MRPAGGATQRVRCFHPLASSALLHERAPEHASPPIPAPASSCAGSSKRFVKTLDIAGEDRQRARRRPARGGRARGRRRRSGGGSPARWWGSSASRGAASRRSAASRSACCRSPAGERYWRGVRLDALAGGRGARAAAASMQMIFQDPVRVAQPAHARRRHRRRGAGGARHDRPASRRSSTWACCSIASGLDPTLMRRYPHQFSRRPARAHRHRARARGEARVPGLRRVGRGARRLDPGAGAQPLHRAARGAQPHVPLHQPRPRRRAASSPTASSSCTWAAWSRARRRPSSSRVPTIRTRRRCWPKWARSQPGKRTFVPIKGEIPSPLDPPRGCHFHPRCPHRDGQVPRGRAAAARDRAGAPVGVPSQRRRMSGTGTR